MTKLPSLSAVIPVHNGEPFLREAIESVLDQGLPIQLIVVNDGSIDGTASIIASYGAAITHISQDRRGLGAARNRGIDAGQSEWIAFLDADDRWVPEKTRVQLQAIVEHPILDMVFGYCVEFSADVTRWPARTQPFTGLSASGMLARRSLFEKAGRFEETHKVGEFLDWYSRAQQSGGRELVLDEVVFHRRVHSSNMTRTIAARRDHYLDVMRSHLRRQRDAAEGASVQSSKRSST